MTTETYDPSYLLQPPIKSTPTVDLGAMITTFHWSSVRVVTCVDNKLTPPTEILDGLRGSVRSLCRIIHQGNRDAGWWHDLNTGAELDRNVGELLMLVVTEIGEAEVGWAGNLMDDKLPQFAMAPVEITDALVRLFDLTEGFGWTGEVAALLPEVVIEDAEQGGFGNSEFHSFLMFALRGVCEAMEAHRKGRSPARGIARAMTRLIRAQEDFTMPIVTSFPAKVAFNRSRADHKPENRRLADGKKI